MKLKFLLPLALLTFSTELLSQSVDSTNLASLWRIECLDSNGVSSLLQWTNEGNRLVALEANSKLLLKGEGLCLDLTIPKLYKPFITHVKRKHGEYEVLIEYIEFWSGGEGTRAFIQYRIPELDLGNNVLISTSTN